MEAKEGKGGKVVVVLVGGYSAPGCGEPFMHLGGVEAKAGHKEEEGGKGVYAFQLDTASGKLSPHESAPCLPLPTPHPAFLLLHPGLRACFAAHDVDAFRGEQGSSCVSSLALEDGVPVRVAKESVVEGGSAACMLEFDHTLRFLACANYSSGTVNVWRLEEEGKEGKEGGWVVGEQTARVQLSGSGPDKLRQTGPHAHCVRFSRDNTLLFVADLGSDAIAMFGFDASTGALSHATTHRVVPGGSGPRFLAFHPRLDVLYCVTEMGAALHTFAVDGAGLTQTSVMGINPSEWPPKDGGWEDFNNGQWGSHLELHPSGRFAFVSSRLINHVVTIALDAGTGAPSGVVARVGSEGVTPRSFVLSKDGKWLLVGNQHSCDVAVFAVDEQTGGLSHTHSARVPYPTALCVVE